MITGGKDILRESGTYHYVLGKPSGRIYECEDYNYPFIQQFLKFPFIRQSQFWSLLYASKGTNILGIPVEGCLLWHSL